MQLLSSVILAFVGMIALADLIEVEVEDNIGGIYELEEIKTGNKLKVFTDRANQFFVEIPEKYVGATYIRTPVQSVRQVPDVDITVELPVPCRVYILWYHEDTWEGPKPARPSDWLKKDYELTKEEFLRQWNGNEDRFQPWKSKEIFPAGQFHTYTSDSDCAYTMFVMTEKLAVDFSGEPSTIWGRIKSF